MLNSDYYLGNITLFSVMFPIFYAIWYREELKEKLNIKTNIHSRNYTSKEVVRIVKIEQVIFYNDHHVYPIDMYPSYDDRTDRKILVFIFTKEDTKEVFQKWIEYKNTLKEENYE